jgi:hypothetical protein
MCHRIRYKRWAWLLRTAKSAVDVCIVNENWLNAIEKHVNSVCKTRMFECTISAPGGGGVIEVLMTIQIFSDQTIFLLRDFL